MAVKLFQALIKLSRSGYKEKLRLYLIEYTFTTCPLHTLTTSQIRAPLLTHYHDSLFQTPFSVDVCDPIADEITALVVAVLLATSGETRVMRRVSLPLPLLLGCGGLGALITGP